MSHIVTAPTTSYCSIYYSNYYAYMIYLATGTTMSLGSIWSQQLLQLMIDIVTATTTSLRSILLQHLLRSHDLVLQPLLYLYDLYHSSNHLIFTHYIVTATLAIL